MDESRFENKPSLGTENQIVVVYLDRRVLPAVFSPGLSRVRPSSTCFDLFGHVVLDPQSQVVLPPSD